jgi:hypothetical protein
VRNDASICFRILRLPTGDLRVASSSAGIATCYILDGPESNPGAGEIFSTRPDRPWVHPASLPVHTGSLSRVKRPGPGVDHPYLSSAQVKERVELYSYYPSGPSWRVARGNLPLNTPVAYPGIFFRGGSTNSVEDRGQRERKSGGGSPLVRGSGGSCNLIQEISFHIVKFS